MDNIASGFLLWVVHFLRSPEGQDILEAAENDLINALEGLAGGTQPTPGPTPGPTPQPTPGPTAQPIPAAAFFNPRKVSSAVGEQPLAEG